MSKRRRQDDDWSDREPGDEQPESDYEPTDLISSPASQNAVPIQDHWDDGQTTRAGRLPPINEQYGQRPMFDASQLKQYDSDQEIEDTDPVAAYLAQVNNERRELPQLVNSTDRLAELQAEKSQGEDSRGRFVDGYYAVHSTTGPQRPADSDEAYFDTIISGYQGVRDILAQPWNMDEVLELSKYGYLSLRFEEPDSEHRANLATVVLPFHQPRELEIKYMETQTAWFIITDVLRLLLALNKGRPLATNVGTWIYFLLARVEPIQTQTPDTISDLRALALLLVDAREAFAARLQPVQPQQALEIIGDHDNLQEEQAEPSDATIGDTNQHTQEDYMATCQIVDTILIIIGVYFRQRDLLEHRRPLPVQHVETIEMTTTEAAVPAHTDDGMDDPGALMALQACSDGNELYDLATPAKDMSPGMEEVGDDSPVQASTSPSIDNV